MRSNVGIDYARGKNQKPRNAIKDLFGNLEYIRMFEKAHFMVCTIETRMPITAGIVTDGPYSITGV